MFSILSEPPVPPDVGEYHLTINVNPSGVGWYDKSPSKYWYNKWDLVTITAYSLVGYATFAYWSIDGEIVRMNPLVMYVTGDHNIVANFYI